LVPTHDKEGKKKGKEGRAGRMEKGSGGKVDPDAQF